MDNALQNGPRFIFGSYQCNAGNQISSLQLPNKHSLQFGPTEFYDEEILKKVGNTIGGLLKVDACTSAALRGRYARLCVELPLNKPVKTNVWIASHKQQIIYEGDKLLCKNCGHLGHSTGQCTKTKQHTSNLVTKENGDNEQSGLMHEHTSKVNEEWKIVTFHKGKKKLSTNESSEISKTAGINVNIFDAITGKFLSSQLLSYSLHATNVTPTVFHAPNGQCHGTRTQAQSSLP